MKFYVTEKLFSIHRKFYIKDEEKNDVYEISSKVISIGDKTTIKDMKGKEISYIKQNLLHLTSNYSVYINEKLTCTISKKLQLFKNDYVIDNGYKIDGSIMMLNFSIYNKADEIIGSIKRRFISIGDKYEIYIKNEKDIPLVLSIIVAITNDVNRNQIVATD